MSEKIAAVLDPERFGVQALYVFGSTKNTTAGPASDLDLIVHVRGTSSNAPIWPCGSKAGAGHWRK